jgi:hypothetical protein
MTQFQAPTATTELEAVNAMLAAIGEAPISQSELDTPARADVDMAVDALQEVMREALSMGWKFNVQWGYELAPTYDSPYTHTFRDASTNDLNIFAPPTGMRAFNLSRTTNQQGTRFSELVVSPRVYSDDLTAVATLAVGSDTAKFATTATATVRIAGGSHNKAAQDDIAFSAADTINTGAAAGYYWGIWLVQVNAAGTVSTKPGGGLSDQVYANKQAALNALPAPDAANVGLGYILVESNSGAAWTAQTDDLVAGSDCLLVTFQDFTASDPIFLNVADQTDGLDEDNFNFLYIDWIKYVGWTNCPEVFRQYCLTRAARRFSERTVGDPDLSGFTRRDERVAYRNLKREQGEKDNYNHFNNLAMFRHLGRFRVYRPEGVWDDRDSFGPAV